MRNALFAALIALVTIPVAWGNMPQAENPFAVIADAGRSRERAEMQERAERARMERVERVERARAVRAERVDRERMERGERAELERRERGERERARTPEFFDPDLLQFASREMPAAAEEIEVLMRTREDWAREELEEWRSYLREMMELRETNPDLYEMEKQLMALDRDAEHLGDRIAEMPKGEEREKAMKSLVEVLKQAFEIKEKMRERDIEILEQELKEQKDALKARRKNRDEIIERRRQELTGEAEILDW